MNPLVVLFQAAIPSIPVFVLSVPVAVYFLWMQENAYPKHFWVTIICGLAVPLVSAAIGYAFYNTDSDFMFAVLKGLLILDAFIFAYALIVFKGLRLVVASIAISTLWFSFFTVFSAGLSIFNTWL